MKQKRPSGRTGSLIAINVGVILGYGGIAVAQPHVDAKRFDIGDQLLASALNEFAHQSDQQILFSTDVVNAKRTQGVKGELKPEAALRELLKGTGLTYRLTADSTILIERRRAKETAAVPRPEEPIRLAQADRATGGAHSHGAGAGRASDRQSPGREVIEIEEVVVTGSHIRDATPTSTVIKISREEIERGGYTSVQEVLKQLPQNFTSTTPVTGGSNIGKTTQIDLRGFGSKSSLTLVNGRRISVAAGDRGRAVDLSMIPLAAVERIEVLTDGASALYGSDAIGGVTNLLLRKDFTGSETTVHYGANATGSDDFFLSQMLGASWQSGRVMLAAQHRRNEALTFHEIGIDTLDFRSRGGSDQRVVGLGDATSNGTVFPALGAFVTPGIPAGTAAVALPAGDGRSLTVDQLAIDHITAGDYGLADLAPEERDSSGYVLLEQEIGSVTLFLDGIYGYRRSHFDQGFLYTQSLVPPGCAPTGATADCNPFSPFAEPVIVFHRLNEFGPVSNDIRREGWAANVGARGGFGGSDWAWEVSGTYSADESVTTIPFSGQPQPVELESRLANPDPALAFNPFGTQSAGVVDALQLPIRTQGRATLKGAAAMMQGSLWPLGGGTARLALGADYREEDLHERQVQLGGVPLVSTSFGVAVDGVRDLRSVFGELYLPLVGPGNARPALRELTLSAAARYERYSDFGDTINPKLGVLWRPSEDLALKASWGSSFRAPSLIELYATVFEREGPVFDPNRPEGTPQLVTVTQRQGGNAGLQEETAHTYTVAAEYRPHWLDHARLSINYFHTEYEDRIRGTLDGLNRNALFQFEDSLPPGIIVRDADGVLQSIFITNINSAETIVSGYDLAAGYFWDTARHGTFDLSATATRYIRYDDRLAEGAPTVDLLGKVGNVPDWRGRLSLTWFDGPWSATVSGIYTDDMWNDGVSATPIVRRDVESQFTVDAQLSYRSSTGGWLHGATVLLGASNVFDDRPPFVDGPNSGLDARNAIIEGRTVYLRVRTGFGPTAR